MQLRLLVGLTALLSAAGLCLADTFVGGVISIDTTWTPADSPYIVGADIMVANNATLSIEPGVQVRFDPGMTLEVALGKLLAQGSEDDMIHFTANVPGVVTESDHWGCIELSKGSSGSVIEHAIIEYAGHNTQGAIRAIGDGRGLHELARDLR